MTTYTDADVVRWRAELVELRAETEEMISRGDAWADRALTAEAALRRVRAIHEPIEAMNYGGRAPRPARVCTGCGTDSGNRQQWPCPTVLALGAAS